MKVTGRDVAAFAMGFAVAATISLATVGHAGAAVFGVFAIADAGIWRALR